MSDSADGRGLTGFVVGGATQLSLGGGPAKGRGLGGLRLGWRFALPRNAAPWLRFGPEVAFAVTDVGGMDSTSDAFSLGHLDGGLQASARLRPRLRLYGVGRYGKRAIELIDADQQVWNYAGGGYAAGGGIEIPLRPSGRGLDVGVNYLSGRFTRADRLKVYRDIDVAYQAWVFHLGWGGPVTIGLPWQ